MLRFSTVLLALGSFALAVGAPLACSDGDDSSTAITPINPDGSQSPPPRFEAGAACLTANDCASGLDCLFPATGCQAFRVCTASITNCAQPQIACSCLGETTTACGGFASDPIDSLGACGDSGIGPVDAGTDTSVDAAIDHELPPADAGSDTNPSGGGDAATDSASE